MNELVLPRLTVKTIKRLVKTQNGKSIQINSDFESYDDYQVFLYSISKINGVNWYNYDFTKDFDTIEAFENTKGRVII